MENRVGNSVDIPKPQKPINPIKHPMSETINYKISFDSN